MGAGVGVTAQVTLGQVPAGGHPAAPTDPDSTDRSVPALAASGHPVPIGFGEPERALAARRVDEYLEALGVADPASRTVLAERVCARVAARAAAAPLESPLETAIEEVLALLDGWLAALLGLESGDADGLLAARTAVLSGAPPGWAERWAAHAAAQGAEPMAALAAGDTPDPTFPARIRALMLPAVPEPAPLTMEPAAIDLFLHRIGCRIAAAVNRLLCPGGQAGAREGARR